MKKQFEQVQNFHIAAGVIDVATPTMDIPMQRKKLRVSLIQEELDEVKEAIEKNDLENLAKELGDVMYTLLGTIHAFGLGSYFEEIFDEVHKSAMSKFDEKGQAVRRADGKILKSKNYKKPDLEKILKKYL